MPEIRSITYFTDIFSPNYQTPLARAGTFLSAAVHAFEESGIVVQTKRVATQPFPRNLTPRGPLTLPTAAASLMELSEAFGINYLSIGCVSPDDDPDYMLALEDMFNSIPGIFATARIADKKQGINFNFLRRTAELIDKISRCTLDGMTNLYFAALANCPPGSPFFPVAYHRGGHHHFALAIQAADIAIQAFENVRTPDEAQHNLIMAIESFAQKVIPIAQRLSDEHGLEFTGLDFSLAPYPTDDKSLGGALEKTGAMFGGQGLVASTALVMNAIEKADFPSTGFSGLMLPILEDSVLGLRTAENRLKINDLLLLSAICGTGLDCIPLPGDIGVDHLYAILLDVAALALRLDKPLTARLMPFPDKKAGDKLEFDFEYFADSKVLFPPHASIQPDSILSAKNEIMQVRPRLEKK